MTFTIEEKFLTNAKSRQIPDGLCIQQMFEAQVELTPDAVAVVFENQQITYRQLNQRANQLAHYLCTLGVGSEVLVGICMERSLEMVVGLLGILKAGGAYVPLDPAYPKERLAFILEDTQAPVILTQEQLVNNLLVGESQVVCLDSNWEAIAQHSQENPVSVTTPDNLIYVIYTSGSTGQPKGVMVPHRGIYNQLYWRQTTFGLTKTDKVLQTISISFDPSVWQIFWPLSFGGQLILPPTGGHQDSAYLVKLIAELQITVIALVPSMLRVLLEEKEIESCKCLRHISCGGEALPVDLIERFFERLNLDNVLHNVYGPTEASIDATFWTCKRGTNRLIAPIGRAIANTQIYILDEDLQPTTIGEPGELYISGLGLARGYLNRDDLTALKFISNPFSTQPESRLYKTGDLARYLPDGNIEFLGRIDQQVKIRGFRIELGEIETALSQHPAVQETVVIAREDVPDSKRLVAYVVPNLKTENFPSLENLRSFLNERLPNHMMPSAFVMLNALPLTPNGKVDRRALPAPDKTRPDLEQAFIAPQNTLEIQLAQIWEEILGIQPIGVKDNFFELGGNSLLAVQFLTQLEQRLNKKLPLATFLQANTIEQLANILSQEESSTLWESLVAIQTSGEKPPLFCIPGVDGNVLIFQNLVRYLDSNQPVYALQPQGLDGKKPFHTRIEDMATYYIKHIRTFQPEGPYFLAAFSAGGVIAFEMARQLSEQGQEIGILALFDTRSPLYFQSLPFRDWLSLHLINLSGLKPKDKLTYFVNGVNERFNKIIYSVKKILKKILFPTNQQPITQEVPFYTVCEQAVRNYTPQIYSGKIILFRSCEQPWWVAGDRLLGWTKLASAGVEVYDIPGQHNSIVRANVHLLAEKLKKCLSASAEV